MSDKVLVDRELLENWESQLDQIAGAWHISDEIAALLTAQPQASAAQSAPAGEREVFCAWYDDNVAPRITSSSSLLLRFTEPAFQAGAAWQRTQSAGVPEGWRLVPVEPTLEMLTHMIPPTEFVDQDLRDNYASLLAAAPAQPAAQSVMCHGCFAQGVSPDHFDAAGKCKAMQPAAQGECVMDAQDAGLPHSNRCAVCDQGPCRKPAAQQEQHPDDQAVDRFAVAMKVKLAKSREKGRHGWQTASAAHLSGLLYRHMYKADPLDVANLAMMLHQNGQAIELPHEARHDQGEVQRLRVALGDAAQSLETISNGAGLDEFMKDASDVRCYARSRAGVARAALVASTGQGVKP